MHGQSSKNCRCSLLVLKALENRYRYIYKYIFNWFTVLLQTLVDHLAALYVDDQTKAASSTFGRRPTMGLNLQRFSVTLPGLRYDV